MNYRKIPLINKFYNFLKRRFDRYDEQLNFLATENLNLRFKLKKLNREKIDVVFVCWRPAVWGSLKTVYEAMKADDNFNVKIVTIPNKKQLPKFGLDHEIYESEGAEDFWKNDDAISGYNYKTGEWLDLRLLKPDYVCFQQPYNVCRTGAEKSWIVNKYAKLFYVHYASNFIGSGILEDSNPPDFVRDVSLYFNQNQMDYDLMKDYFKKIGNNFTKLYLTGFPRYDNLEKYRNCKSSNWSLSSENSFRLVWTPRWTTNENNCHFFDYKDKLLDYVRHNKDVDFIFRPHPQAFLEWNSTGELPNKEADAYRGQYDELENAKIDYSKEYLTTFYTSNCMVTDVSSIVAEYFLTGKPVIYCHRVDCFNDFSRKIAEGFYWVHNWNELRNTLDMLKSGNDPLKEKRMELIKSEYYIPKGGAGNMIKEIIKRDFYND